VPGQSSEVFSRYFRRLTRLIEDASEKNENKKVILFGHSFGGMVALEFVRSTPMAWRNRYIKHLILAAPVPAEGVVVALQYFVSGSDLMYIPTVTQLALTLRPMWRSFESSIVNFPSTAVFGDRPLVVTARRNYSAYDVEDLLVAIGFGAGVEPFRRRSVPKMNYFQAPMVPTTCINGVRKNNTPEQLVYWDGDFDAEPEIVYGDGDQIINLISMLAFDEKMRRQPEQNKVYKSIKLH
jgi:pimeloyl-ACP methyl ester carboxylesterase